MAMAENGAARHQAIATAIGAELERQSRTGAVRIDIEAMTAAVERALAPSPAGREGKRPADLNATNDD